MDAGRRRERSRSWKLRQHRGWRSGAARRCQTAGGLREAGPEPFRPPHGGWLKPPRRTRGPAPPGLRAFDGCSRARPAPDVLRRRADQAALALLLEDVRRPAGHARAGEHRREQLRRHLGVVEHDRRPELDVRRQHAVGLARLQLGERGLLERLGDLEARRAELARGAPQHPRARVLGAVDAVAEAHQPLAAVERVLDPALGVAELLDLVEHLQHARGRAAVQRAGQRADGARERGRDVGAGGGDRRAR